MNEKIEIFLHFCEPEEVKPGYWEGNFNANKTQTSLLYKMRDELTDDDWLDIVQAAQPGYDLLPNNLKLSLKRKFDDFEEFIIENNLEGLTIPEILRTGIKYKQAQKFVWGVVSSAIECVWFHQRSLNTNKNLFDYS